MHSWAPSRSKLRHQQARQREWHCAELLPCGKTSLFEGSTGVIGTAGEAVPGSEPSLPAPAALLPSERKAESKPPRPSKPVAKPAKAVELPPAAFQAPEPFVPPPAISKVCCSFLYACTQAGL